MLPFKVQVSFLVCVWGGEGGGRGSYIQSVDVWCSLKRATKLAWLNNETKCILMNVNRGVAISTRANIYRVTETISVYHLHTSIVSIGTVMTWLVVWCVWTEPFYNKRKSSGIKFFQFHLKILIGSGPGVASDCRCTLKLMILGKSAPKGRMIVGFFLWSIGS